MNKQQFRGKLKGLHVELQHIYSMNDHSINDHARELIHCVMNDIQHLLTGEDTAHRYHALNKRLTIAIRHFEQTHPMLVLTMGEVSAMLSNMGI